MTSETSVLVAVLAIALAVACIVYYIVKGMAKKKDEAKKESSSSVEAPSVSAGTPHESIIDKEPEKSKDKDKDKDKGTRVKTSFIPSKKKPKAPPSAAEAEYRQLLVWVPDSVSLWECGCCGAEIKEARSVCPVCGQAKA